MGGVEAACMGVLKLHEWGVLKLHAWGGGGVEAACMGGGGC